MQKALALSVVLAIPLAASADPYLKANGALVVLTGETPGGYLDQIWPATQYDTLTGSDSISATKGPYQPGNPDIFASSSSTSVSKFGEVSEQSLTTAKGYSATASAGEGSFVSKAFDIITVHGSGTIQVTLNSLYSGYSTASAADAASTRSRAEVYLGPAGFVNDSESAYLSNDFGSNSVFNQKQSMSFNATDGQSFYLLGDITTNNDLNLQNGALDSLEYRTVSASTHSDLSYWVGLSSGATLSSESGWGYAAPAAVPEPGSVLCFGVGVVGLLVRRKRRS